VSQKKFYRIFNLIVLLTSIILIAWLIILLKAPCMDGQCNHRVILDIFVISKLGFLFLFFISFGYFWGIFLYFYGMMFVRRNEFRDFMQKEKMAAGLTIILGMGSFLWAVISVLVFLIWPWREELMNYFDLNNPNISLVISLILVMLLWLLSMIIIGFCLVLIIMTITKLFMSKDEWVNYRGKLKHAKWR